MPASVLFSGSPRADGTRTVSPARFAAVLAVAAASLLASPSIFAADEPGKATIPITRPERKTAVDFNREILPVFTANCLACHNRTTTKADLLLESPADLLKGGESGPAIVAGKSAESLLLKLASHAAKPRMPPRENKANAHDLTSAELGLIALWIDQGAKASEKHEETIAWHSLPARLHPIFAVAVSPDGNFAACGRANQIDVYHLPTRRLSARLIDPALGSTNEPAGAAHRDFVNSLAFSPDSGWLASGGYREVKLWRLDPTPARVTAPSAPTNTVTVADRKVSAALDTNGTAYLFDPETNRFIFTLQGEATARRRQVETARALSLLQADAEFRKSQAEAAGKELQAQAERLKKADEAGRATAKALAEKQAGATKARSDKELADVLLARLEQGGTNAPAYVDKLKQAKERIEAAGKAVEKADGELKTAQQKEGTAENEQQLAALAVRRAEGGVSSTGWELRRSQEARQKASADADAAPVTSWPAVRAVAVSTEGTWAATANDAKTVTLWRAETGVAVSDFTAPAEGVTALRFATNDTLIADGPAGPVEWKLALDWKLARTLGTGGPGSPLADRVNSLAFRPDGLRLASGGGEPSRSGEILLWNPADGSLLQSFTNIHSDAVLALGFSPDGWQLASGAADRFARVTELASGRVVRAFEGHTGHVLALGWAADGRTLITAGADNVAKFWDFVSGDRRKTITGFSKELTGVGYLGTAAHVFIASGDTSVRVYNENAEKVRDLESTADFINAAAITADGTLLAVGGQDGVLRIWRGIEGKPAMQFAPTAEPQVVAK